MRVRPAAERLVALRARMRELVETQGKLVNTVAGNGAGYAAGDLTVAQEELEQLATEAASCVADLEEIGVVVKDLDLGLLDFPAIRDGEDVELCWRAGEDEVAYWHEPGAGYPGRKPIDWDE